MSRGLLVPLSALVLALYMAGCSSKPKNGECKSSDDCARQQGYGKFCIDRRCQECGVDTDCEAGLSCRDNRCMPRDECSQDADCSEGNSCVEGRCAARNECNTDAQCGPGQGCEQGRCLTKEVDPGPGIECGNEDHAVRFEFNRAELTEESRGILDGVAECLRQKGGSVPLTVEGHADERGTSEYNIQLAQRRAETVKRYLTNRGLNPRSIKALSYGKERPLCTESHEPCWARNRRGVVTSK